MTTSTDILLAAADLLDAPGAWCRGAFARDAESRPVSARDPSAECWCAFGAISRASQDADHAAHDTACMRLSEQLAREGYEPGIVDWNEDDFRTRTQVVRMLRRAAQQ